MYAFNINPRRMHMFVVYGPVFKHSYQLQGAGAPRHQEDLDPQQKQILSFMNTGTMHM